MAKEASPAGLTVKVLLVPVVPLRLAPRVRESVLSSVTRAVPWPLTTLTQVGVPPWPSLVVRDTSPVQPLP